MPRNRAVHEPLREYMDLVSQLTCSLLRKAQLKFFCLYLSNVQLSRANKFGITKMKPSYRPNWINKKLYCIHADKNIQL